MSMSMKIDIGGLADAIGVVYAADDLSHEGRFMGDLIDAAYAKTNREFNREVVATAMSGGGLSHMFEWGTIGITRGRATLNANNPVAQLWRNQLVGEGTARSIGFTFMPSVRPVPVPTTENSGISSDVLSKLNRHHVFTNKAAVMEEGITVTITPKNGKYLFIPFYGAVPDDSSDTAKAKGYTMYAGSVRVVPGRSVHGTFTAFWQQFWTGRGGKLIEENVETRFNDMMTREFMTSEASRLQLTPTTRGRFEQAVASASNRTRNRFIQQARAARMGAE